MPDCTYSPFTKNHIYAVLPLTPCIFGTVSQRYLRCCFPACSLHFAPNKTTHNSQLCVFFFKPTILWPTWQMLTFTQLLGSMERLLQAGSDCPALPDLLKLRAPCPSPGASRQPHNGLRCFHWLESGPGYGPECGPKAKCEISQVTLSRKGDYNFCHLEEMSYQPFKSSSQIPLQCSHKTTHPILRWSQKRCFSLAHLIFFRSPPLQGNGKNQRQSA